MFISCIFILQVNTNGIISIDAPFYEYIPSPFPYSEIPLVAPFWHDANTLLGGKIYYRETSDPVLLQQFNKEVKNVTDIDSFAPTALFIATWLRVPPYSSFYYSSQVGKAYILISLTKGKVM